MALRILAALGLAGLAAAAPKSEGLHKRWLETRGETLFNVFKRDGDATSLAYVENSGICVWCPILNSSTPPPIVDDMFADNTAGDDRGCDDLFRLSRRGLELCLHHAHVVLVSLD